MRVSLSIHFIIVTTLNFNQIVGSQLFIMRDWLDTILPRYRKMSAIAISETIFSIHIICRCRF